MENDIKDRELLITRVLNAPIDLVWEAWTKPEHIAKWWGPNGFTNTITTMDMKPGGEWNLVMHGWYRLRQPKYIQRDRASQKNCLSACFCSLLYFNYRV